MNFVTVLIVSLLSFSGAASAGHDTGGGGNNMRLKPSEVAKARPVHIPISENGIVGTLILPDTKHTYPGVLRIGGGEGGISVSDAETIAAEGYAVLALAYFAKEGLPPELEEVPLEYFGKAVAWMKRSPNIDSSKLGIIGISRGSTLALLVPTIYPKFDAVVALAPTHVMWQATYLNWDNYAEKSSHSWQGKPLPFVPYDFSNKAAMVGCDGVTAACTKMYEHSLEQQDRVSEALIPVEKIGAPVLLLSGKADSMWPSSAMSDLVIRRLDERNFPYEHRHITYENSGHCGINRCYDHVPLKGDKAAVEDMRRQLFQFLDRHLRPKSPAG